MSSRFNFQLAYSSARAQNIIPWGIGPYMINNQYEIGHFEPCTSLSNPDTSASDPTFKTCEGPYESAADTPAANEPDDAPYYPDWPNSVKPDSFPSSFLQLQPTTVGGRGYPQIQFMTDASATEFNTNCDLVTGSGCVLPPKGPGHFYPYFTQAKVGGACVWEFGNMRNGNTFGKDAQYGSVTPTTIGAFAGPVRSNPHC